MEGLLAGRNKNYSAFKLWNSKNFSEINNLTNLPIDEKQLEEIIEKIVHDLDDFQASAWHIASLNLFTSVRTVR